MFGPGIRKARPDVEAIAHKNLTAMGAKMRLTKDQKADLLLESQISLNSPLKKSFAVAGPHHDAITKIWGGLLYMRQDNDTSTGADLQGVCIPESGTTIIRHTHGGSSSEGCNHVRGTFITFYGTKRKP